MIASLLVFIFMILSQPIAYARDIRVGENFIACKKTGCMGVVKDTDFIRCFWPNNDEPTKIFEGGSLGLHIEGPPTPRNIIFPDDTTFGENTRSDCWFKKDALASDKDYKERLSSAVDEIGKVEAKSISDLKAADDAIIG